MLSFSLLLRSSQLIGPLKASPIKLATNGYSRIALIGAIVAFGFFCLAGVLYVQGTDALQRLALLFGVFGLAVPQLIALLKVDTAATHSQHVAEAIDNAVNGTVPPEPPKGTG